jgi:hypothetical protein
MGYNTQAIRDVTNDDIASIPVGAAMQTGLTHPDGTVIQAATGETYWIQNGFKRTIPSSEIYGSWFAWNEIVHVSDLEVMFYPPGNPLGFGDGSWLHFDGGSVQVVSGGQRRPVVSLETFNLLGLSWAGVRNATSADAAYNAPGPSI